ncbi:MAG: tRNA (guanosine(46)-N7)-methyltransferase TrmB, partial [Bacilli bacterium]|nr:tRNA (guanosine(46)-N7)-methyltransferase TrmB [Bacilli bacterium]
NVRLTNADFDFVVEDAPELRFDVIYLNFSDPWPKKKHAKRRLTFLPRLKKILSLLKEEGELRIKTDNDILYAFTLEQIALLEGYIMTVNEEDYVFDAENDSMSEYESAFREEGKKIHRIILKKEI